MIIAYLILFLLLGAAIYYLVRPFLKPAQPFPQSPRPEELRAELEVLKNLAKEAEGEERKRILAQAVRLERQLDEFGTDTPTPRRINPATVAVVAASLALLVVGLGAYTFPRLPGETIITSRNEARELGELERRANTSGTAADWLALADKAYELNDFERAAHAYLRAAQLEPRNPTAVRRLGILLFMSGRPEEAIQALELATGAEPSVAEGWLFLGNAYFQQNKPQQAIRAWEGYLKAGGPAVAQVQNLIQTAKGQLVSSSPGQAVFLGKCAACHGAQAQGGTGPRLSGNNIVKVPEAVREIVTKGRGQMAPVPLSEQELRDLLSYVGGL